LSLVEQLGKGLLDDYPLDKAAAEGRLKMHIEGGDITAEELQRFSYSE
jgi:hypothetical protein